MVERHGPAGLEHEAVVGLASRHFETPSGEALPLSGDPPAFSPSVRHETRDDLQQLYLSLGTRGAAYGDADRYPLVVLNTLLGGGMSSRLFQRVREEAGLAYSIFSSPDFHRDAGLVSIHLGVGPDKGPEALALVREELEALRERGPSAEEVEAAKAQLRGSILMGQESVSSRMYHLAGEEIYMRRHATLEEHAGRIAGVAHEQVVDVARRYLAPERFTLAALGPASSQTLSERDWGVEAVLS